MDFQNRVGSKTGGGGPASYSESNRDRRERLAALAAETIDLAKVSFVIENVVMYQYYVILSCVSGPLFHAESSWDIRV